MQGSKKRLNAIFDAMKKKDPKPAVRESEYTAISDAKLIKESGEKSGDLSGKRLSAKERSALLEKREKRRKKRKDAFRVSPEVKEAQRKLLDRRIPKDSRVND